MNHGETDNTLCQLRKRFKDQIYIKSTEVLNYYIFSSFFNGQIIQKTE